MVIRKQSSFNRNDVCVQTLLKIVARGHVIIAELLKLVDFVPEPFKFTNGEPLVNQFLDKERKLTVDSLIFDFCYFKNADNYESRIEANEVLKKADEDLCDSYNDILTRFYLTFESILRYAKDLNSFIVELEEDTFIGQSLDSILQNSECLQLLCESFFLLGYMLLTTDNNFEGELRERLIVSYYRYSSYKSTPNSSIDETCNLMRSTGLKTPQQQTYRKTSMVTFNRPDKYPENFFARVEVNQSFINLLIAKLQSEDIYTQSSTTFPHPDHRSTALNRQAAMLYVILYFCPNVLSSQRSRMREITDKFFYDNWIINIYMGELVNLIEAWEPYRAARESLIQLLDIESTKNLVNQYNLKFHRVSKQLQDGLTEGWLNEEIVLANHLQILNQIRDANVILRWMLIHSQNHPNWQLKLTRTIHSSLCSSLPARESLYTFLQNLSNLEKRFTSTYSNVVEQRSNVLIENKSKAMEVLNELLEIFNGTRPMRWVQATGSSTLSTLLKKIVIEVEKLDLGQPESRDLIIGLLNEVQSMQDSYSDGKNLQVVQLFADIKDHLLTMFRLLDLPDETINLLRSICDFSYAWQLMDVNFTPHIQQLIKENPLKVYGLESVVSKLALTVDLYLVRLHQADSKSDLSSVSNYYSNNLVTYLRDVLHIIPSTILELVSSIISIQTEQVMNDMPHKIPMDSLKDYALPEIRFNMLNLTYKIAHYAESMMMMQSTQIGHMQINSKQLLEDGIRRELVKRMSDSIQEVLQFSDRGNLDIHSTARNLLTKMARLQAIMTGYKRSFEYIQDYIFIYGLRMWQEELTRIVKFNVDQAVEVLINERYLQSGGIQSISELSSIYQSIKAPIPTYSPDPMESSFIVRIFHEILKITDPRNTIYEEQMGAWYEQKGQRDKVADLKVFELIASSLSVSGLNGLDQMCSALLVVELKRIDNLLISMTTSDTQQGIGETVLAATKSLMATTNNSDILNQHRRQPLNRIFAPTLVKLAPYSEKIVNHLLRIGQLQAIRVNISCVLSTRCRYEARNLYNCLHNLNTTLLSTIKRGKVSCQQQKESTSSYDDDSSFDESSFEGSQVSRDEQRRRQFVDDDDGDQLQDSQTVFELTNHLEWIGLSDPFSKIYTLSLQSSSNSLIFNFREQLVAMDILFFILLDQCPKLHFSRSISGFVPKQAKSFYESSSNLDGQPLFYGIMTLISHYQPFLSKMKELDGDKSVVSNSDSGSNRLDRLLQLMGMFAKLSIDQIATHDLDTSATIQNLSLEGVNMILIMFELIRLSRKPADELLSSTVLPKFFFDTFQFNLCHLGERGSNNTID